MACLLYTSSQVIDYAVTLPYVDADRIGVIGVCGGGGYVLNATLTEKLSLIHI